jgi:DNA helicase-2/ATP-dependent DNA helicase PcrA
MKDSFKIDIKLNPAQLAAVKAPMGAVLILAGAGSGKTKALTLRIVYLIKKMGVSPKNILAVTFTNKAAGEIKDRIIRLLKKSDEISNSLPHRPAGKFLISNLPNMGTFHSIGARILRSEAELVGLKKDFVIYDDDDQESLLKEILTQLNIDPTKLKPSLFGAIIDRCKNNLETPADLETKDKGFTSKARRVYELYQKKLLDQNAVDFGDLIMMPVVLFQKHPEVLKKYQNFWQYILVDEYQDTNYTQYIFTKLLAEKNKNIFVVGDDAQAIYGFRGANLQNILDFEKDYPKATIIKLEQNYRSTSPILSVAQCVIELNPLQHSKKLWTEKEQGETPVLYSAVDELAEGHFVASKIVQIQDKQTKELEYIPDEDDSILGRLMRASKQHPFNKLKNRSGLNNIAILYRTHHQSRALEEAMIEYGIPYQIIGGLKFYERREIKDMIAFLRLVLNPSDLVSLKRVINVPPRSIGPKTFDGLKEALLNKKEEDLKNLFIAKPAVKLFFDSLDKISQYDGAAPLADILTLIVRTFNYENYLRDGSEEGDSRFENVQELFNVASAFKKLPWREGLVKFLEEVALMTSADELDLSSPKVTLMTLHQAKGLEFDIVFLVGLEEGLLPHSRSLADPKDLAEEVRLAYVGITRAKQQLFLVHALSRKQFGSRNISVPSRILRAIPEEMLTILQ